MNLAQKLPRTRALQIVLGLIALDLLAILIGIPLADFYLRPLILLAMVCFGAVYGETYRSGAWLLLAGLSAAVVVEALQKLEIMAEIMVVGTALYYLFYCLAFIRFPTFKFAWGATIMAWVFVGLYCSAMFWWLEPYALRVPAMIYMVVATVMVGLALTPQLIGDPTLAARRQTVGVIFLLFSDSLRAIAIFKLSYMKEDYLVANLFEALIMIFFFAGQFFLVRSLIPRPHPNEDAP